MVKITVVIPAKNRAGTLPYCIKSVLTQTHPADEVIVVDDHSDDETRSLVEQFSQSKVRYECLVHSRGAQAARNHGIKCASYDWIAFQDSDDVWMPNKLEMQVAELAKFSFNKNLVVHTSGFKQDSASSKISNINTDSFEGNCYKKLLLQSGPMFQGILVSKDALFNIGMLDENCPSYQEWDTSIMLANHCDFVHIKTPLFEWVLHAKETISKNKMIDVLGFFYVIKKHRLDIINHYGDYGWRYLVLQNFCRSMRFGLKEEALKMLDELSCHSSKCIAKLFIDIDKLPRGAERLFKIISKSIF